MTSAVTFRDEAGHLVIPQPFPMAGRIFGALFIVPGLKLTWDLSNALIEVGRAMAWQWSDIFAFGIWLVMALVFLVPGWAIATMRRRVTIDRGHRQVRQMNDFLFYRWSATRSLSDFDAVRLFVLPPTSSSPSTRRVAYHVELQAPNKKSLLIFIEHDEDRARTVAQEIATFAALPLRSTLEMEADAEPDETA